MKKTTLLFALLTLSSFAFAETKVEITPEYDASGCVERRFSQVVNQVTNLQKIEDADTVTVSFDTRLYKCSKRGFEAREISAYRYLSIFNEGINFPWAYEPDYKIENVSPLESHVTLEFKKSVIFKKKNQRTFSYLFKTADPKSLYYYWNVQLTYDKGSDTTSVNFSQTQND